MDVNGLVALQEHQQLLEHNLVPNTAKYATTTRFQAFFSGTGVPSMVQLLMTSRNGPWRCSCSCQGDGNVFSFLSPPSFLKSWAAFGDKNHFKLAQLCSDGASGTIGDVGNPEKKMMKRIFKRWWIIETVFLIIVDPIFTQNSTFSSGLVKRLLKDQLFSERREISRSMNHRPST